MFGLIQLSTFVIWSLVYGLLFSWWYRHCLRSVRPIESIPHMDMHCVFTAKEQAVDLGFTKPHSATRLCTDLKDVDGVIPALGDVPSVLFSNADDAELGNEQYMFSSCFECQDSNGALGDGLELIWVLKADYIAWLHKEQAADLCSANAHSATPPY